MKIVASRTIPHAWKVEFNAHSAVGNRQLISTEAYYTVSEWREPFIPMEDIGFFVMEDLEL